MRTDHLIALLVADLKPVDRARVFASRDHCVADRRRGGFRCDASCSRPTPRNIRCAEPGTAFLPQFARPGAEGHGFLLVVCLPFAAIGILAAVPLAATDWGGWSGMIFAGGWLTRLPYIPLFALAPFAAVVCGLRAGAPTELPQAGAAACLVAGGLPERYGLRVLCQDESIAAVAVWYGATIFYLCAHWRQTRPSAPAMVSLRGVLSAAERCPRK